MQQARLTDQLLDVGRQFVADDPEGVFEVNDADTDTEEETSETEADAEGAASV